MKTFLIISVVVTATLGDVNELLNAYHYDKPVTSYGVPSFTVNNKYTTGGSTINGFKGGIIESNSGTSGGFNTGASGGFNTGTSSGFNTGTSGGFNTGGSQTTGSNGFIESNSGTSGGFKTGVSGGFNTGTSSGFNTGVSGGFNTGTSSGFNTGTSGGFNTGGRSESLSNRYITNSGVNIGQNVQNSNLGASSASQGSLASNSGSFQQSGTYQTGQYNTGYQTTGQQSFENYDTSSHSGTYQQNYNFVQSGPPQIFKHFYVHVAPEEPEHVKHQNPIVLPPKQKHYNIIFVKTPTPAISSSQVIPVQQQSEEKTIVYVLVQKPEDVNNVVLPKFTPNPPSKPEVFFIKYNGKENAHGVINNIVNDYQKHDSVSFNGIGVSNDELSGNNVIIHDKQSVPSKYEIPISGTYTGQQTVSISETSDKASNNYVSTTQGSAPGSDFGTSNFGISTSGSSSTTPGYNGAGSSSFLATSGLGGFETGNEVTIGSAYTKPTITGSSGSSSSQFSISTSGQGPTSNGGEVANNYQTFQIETSSVGSTNKGSDDLGLSSIQSSTIRPIESSSLGPSSTLHAIVTGNDFSSSTVSSLGNNENLISTSLNVPFETYGPPNFKP